MPEENKTAALLAFLWQKNKPLVDQRITELEQATEAPEKFEEAAATAHKLAGSLGMYGYPEAGQIASTLELEFSSPAPQNLKEKVVALRNALS